MTAPAAAAVESLTERLQRNPNSLAFSRLADHYRKEGDVGRAVDLCTKGLERYPDYCTGYLILGRCYLEQEKLDKAVSALVNVCRIDRRNIVAIKMLADIFMRQGLLEKAADLYALLAKIDPYDALLARAPHRKKGSGGIDLFEILGLSPAMKAPALAAIAKPPQRPAGAATEDMPQFVSLEELGLSQADTVMTDIGSATEQLLSGTDTIASEADRITSDRITSDTITGSDVSERMSMLFGEDTKVKKARPKPKQPKPGKPKPDQPALDQPPPPPPAPAPEEEAAAAFEVKPPAETPRREDPSGKETIKMPSLKGPPKTGSTINADLEETMIIDADEAMLLRGDSGIRIKETVAPDAESRAIDDTRTQELFGGTAAQPEAPIEKPQENLDDLVESLQKENFEGAVPEGAVSEGAVPEGAVSEGAVPEGAVPEGAVPEGAVPEGAVPEGAVPEAAVFEPPRSTPAGRDTVTGDEVSARIDGLFKETAEPPQAQAPVPAETPAGKKDALPAEPEPAEAPVFEKPITGRLDDDVERTAMFLHHGETISGDDVVERLEGIFKDKKEIKKPAAETPEKKEETDTVVMGPRGRAAAPDAVKPAGAADTRESESVIETVSAVSGKDVEKRLDEFFREPESAESGRKKDETAAGPERTVVELPRRPVKKPQPAAVSPSDAPEAGQDEPYEETIILDAADVFSPPDDTMPETATPVATPLPEKTQPSREETLRFDDIEFDVQPRTPPAPAAEKQVAEDARESTAVFEDFSSANVPQAPAPAPEVPVFGPTTSSADTVWDLAAAAGSSADAVDSIPEHVLTPTIADIYFKQGQPQLALNIYRRLVDKDPGNSQLQLQIREIEKAIARGTGALKPPAPKRIRARKKAVPKEGVPREEATASEALPLAGVRLRKKIRPKLEKSSEGQE